VVGVNSSERKFTSFRIVTTIRFLARRAIPTVMKIRSRKKVKGQMVSVPRTDVLKFMLNKTGHQAFPLNNIATAGPGVT
jgi:hypothetical protein